jgi:hypothetical protein
LATPLLGLKLLVATSGWPTNEIADGRLNFIGYQRGDVDACLRQEGESE